jgi:hypothetical protein
MDLWKYWEMTLFSMQESALVSTENCPFSYLSKSAAQTWHGHFWNQQWAFHKSPLSIEDARDKQRHERASVVSMVLKAEAFTVPIMMNEKYTCTHLFVYVCVKQMCVWERETEKQRETEKTETERNRETERKKDSVLVCTCSVIYRLSRVQSLR